MAHYTAEQLVELWEDRNAIENLASRFAFFDMLHETDVIYDRFWAKNTDGLSIGMNDGYYVGDMEIRRYYDAIRLRDSDRAKAAKALRPEEFKDREPEDLVGVGSLPVLNLTTPVVEIAGDGKTAKGLWYIISGDVEHYTEKGPIAVNRWGRVGIDFVKEEDDWKLWHVLFAIDFEAPMGTAWDLPGEQEPPVLPFTFAGKNHELYHNRRILDAFPPIPTAYETFTDTFSYGPTPD